jgi:hypothetical protein
MQRHVSLPEIKTLPSAWILDKEALYRVPNKKHSAKKNTQQSIIVG